MARYWVSAVSTSTANTVGGFIASLKGHNAIQAKILAVEIFTDSANATAGGVGLARSTALGTGAATGITPISVVPGETAATSRLNTAYATAVPTTGAASTPSTIFRRFTHGAVGGAGVIWRWSELAPLLLPINTDAAGELVIVNLKAATPALYQINIELEE